jgi:MbtH protein
VRLGAREAGSPLEGMGLLPDDLKYDVVANDEEQWSIWPSDRPLPDGWKSEGFSGLRETCLDYIDANWTDMRPLSVREWLNP